VVLGHELKRRHRVGKQQNHCAWGCGPHRIESALGADRGATEAKQAGQELDRRTDPEHVEQGGLPKNPPELLQAGSTPGGHQQATYQQGPVDSGAKAIPLMNKEPWSPPTPPM